MTHKDRLSLLVLALILPLMTSCSHVMAKATTATEAIPVRAASVVSRDVPLDILAVGNVEASDTVAVKSRATGQIARVEFQEGENVTRGQTLFTIDPRTVEIQTAELRADVQRDASMEQQARATALRDAASQKQSESEADIARKLGMLGVISQQRVDQLATVSATALASLHSNEAALRAAKDTSRADQARLAQMQLQLSFTRIVAPISGRAGSVMVKAGNMIRENDTTLVTLLQLAPIQVTFGIPEQSLAEIQRLNAEGSLGVEANSDGSPAVEGKLVFIDNTVDAATGTIRMKATFSNASHLLWPGEFVHVRLRLRMDKNKMLLPESAIQNGLDGKYVWLVRSDSVTVAPVHMERMYESSADPAQAVIASGVHPGDLVVTEGQLRLTAGAKVSVMATPRAGPDVPAASQPPEQ